MHTPKYLTFISLLAFSSVALAQATITDGKKRPTQWMACEVRASDRPDLPYYYSPIFSYDDDVRKNYVHALYPYWENGGEAKGYMIYKAPECYKYDTRAEAEKSIEYKKSKHASSKQIGS